MQTSLARKLCMQLATLLQVCKKLLADQLCICSSRRANLVGMLGCRIWNCLRVSRHCTRQCGRSGSGSWWTWQQTGGPTLTSPSPSMCICPTPTLASSHPCTFMGGRCAALLILTCVGGFAYVCGRPGIHRASNLTGMCRKLSGCKEGTSPKFAVGCIAAVSSVVSVQGADQLGLLSCMHCPWYRRNVTAGHVCVCQRQ